MPLNCRNRNRRTRFALYVAQGKREGNNLTIGPAGGNGGADIRANAAALPVLAGGKRVNRA